MESAAAWPSLAGIAVRVVAVAAAYYVAGRLGLLLAIPPGYATAVYPASGIALAAVLLGGRWCALGAGLGSFVLNALAHWDATAPVASLAVPAVIGTGAAAQALLGAFLIRRFVGYTNLLVQELDVVRILLFGGPLACVLNASVSVGTLWYAGKVSAQGLWLNAWTWWVGDSIGVLVFTPLVLVWAVRPYSVWLQRQLFVTVPLVGLFATVVALFVFVSEREQARIRSDLEGIIVELGRDLQEDVDTTMTALGSLEGFFASSARVEEYEFQIFARRLLDALPAARALSWLQLVPGAERRRFEAGAREHGHPTYRLNERADDGVVAPAGERAYYAAYRYIVPLTGNEALLGFDALSEPASASALNQARDSAGPAATRVVRLLQLQGAPGLLAFMPVYRHGVQPHSMVARRRYIEGFAAATFEIERMMAKTVSAARRHGLAVQLFDDGTPGAPERLFGDTAPAASGADRGIRGEFRFNFAGRPLRLEFESPGQGLLARHSWETWFVLAGGLALISLVGMLLLLGVGRAARVEALVEARTRELRKLNADLMEEASRRRRLEAEAAKRAAELADSNVELQRRAEVNRQLLRSLRHSEGELRRTASQLAVSNRELEQFAYVASHDLKAPLRSIGSFAQLLERRHGDRLGGESKEFLGFIQAGIRNMQALIDDLLQLSRVDARRLEPAQVQMTEVVERACKQLTADLKASHAEVHAGTLPEVHADANMLVQLLQNLIGNAIKFQAAGSKPEIWIDATVDGDDWHITVRDNGIGIDPRHLDQIFLVFKRLHTTDKYAGSGIGLAVCKKVVNLHGGEIWAESQPGAGTTIHFTLPQRTDARAGKVAAA